MKTETPDGVVMFTETEGDRMFRSDLPVVPRNSVLAIVQRNDSDEFICLHWNRQPIRAFVTGGVKQDEDPFVAAVREIRAETGFQGVVTRRTVCPAFRDRFFHIEKQENRDATVTAVFCLIANSDYREPDQKELDHHKVWWIPRKKVESFLTVESHKYAWNAFARKGA